MIYRFLVFDALSSLARGHLLTEVGGGLSICYHLEGVPEVCHVFDDLRVRGLIQAPEGGIRRWRLTERGAAEFERGLRWYLSLPLHRRILGRLGVRLPDQQAA